MKIWLNLIWKVGNLLIWLRMTLVWACIFHPQYCAIIIDLLFTWNANGPFTLSQKYNVISYHQPMKQSQEKSAIVCHIFCFSEKISMCSFSLLFFCLGPCFTVSFWLCAYADKLFAIFFKVISLPKGDKNCLLIFQNHF